MSIDCYYEDSKYCTQETWTCESCQQKYCTFHWHETDNGENVECVACEREREEEENEDDDDDE